MLVYCLFQAWWQIFHFGPGTCHSSFELSSSNHAVQVNHPVVLSVKRLGYCLLVALACLFARDNCRDRPHENRLLFATLFDYLAHLLDLQVDHILFLRLGLDVSTGLDDLLGGQEVALHARSAVAQTSLVATDRHSWELHLWKFLRQKFPLGP